jgi:hypothetical protein
MRSWDLRSLPVQSHAPEILSSGRAGRAIVLEIPSGERLKDHQVHERAWVVVADGTVEVATPAGQRVSGGPGLLVEFDPAERHAVQAITTARLLLLLAPWPGEGHPGTMALSEKASVRERAAEHRS